MGLLCFSIGARFCRKQEVLLRTQLGWKPCLRLFSPSLGRDVGAWPAWVLPALSLSPAMGPRSSWKDLEGSREDRSWDEADVGFRGRAAQIVLTFP